MKYCCNKMKNAIRRRDIFRQAQHNTYYTHLDRKIKVRGGNQYNVCLTFYHCLYCGKNLEKEKGGL